MTINWTNIISAVISWIITTSLAVIGGWMFGSKKSMDTIGRKEKIYQPIVDELEIISTYKLDVLIPINIVFIREIAKNDYKYALDDNSNFRFKQLINLVEKYNKINLVTIANNILIREFKIGFEQLYGSIIDGYATYCDYDGNEYEEEVEAPEYQAMYQMDFNKEIFDLLYNGDIPGAFVSLPSGDQDVINESMVKIFNSALSATYDNGEAPKRKMLIDWSDTPGSYIAYYSNFTEDLENDAKYIEKYKLREEIILLAQELQQEYKDYIAKIVKKYEKEKL